MAVVLLVCTCAQYVLVHIAIVLFFKGPTCLDAIYSYWEIAFTQTCLLYFCNSNSVFMCGVFVFALLVHVCNALVMRLFFFFVVVEKLRIWRMLAIGQTTFKGSCVLIFFYPNRVKRCIEIFLLRDHIYKELSAFLFYSNRVRRSIEWHGPIERWVLRGAVCFLVFFSGSRKAEHLIASTLVR